MPDSRKYLHPEALRRIGKLDLRARHVVEGYLSGMHRSPHFGQSVEFRQHRQYTPGDDLRHVDWQVWARQDRLYIRQYESDEKMQVNFLVDVSNSMDYGNGPLNKFDYGATIAVSLAWLALKYQDSVGCLTFDDDVRDRIATSSRNNQLQVMSAMLERSTKSRKSELSPIFSHAAEIYPKRGMMVVISDLFSPPEETLKGLRLLRQKGHDVLVFHVLDEDELEFPFTGATRFEDMESDTMVRCNPKSLKRGYLDAMAQFQEQIRHGCAKAGISYALINTADPIDAALAGFLSRRMAG